jgi:hypothetical protein
MIPQASVPSPEIPWASDISNAYVDLYYPCDISLSEDVLALPSHTLHCLDGH